MDKYFKQTYKIIEWRNELYDLNMPSKPIHIFSVSVKDVEKQKGIINAIKRFFNIGGYRLKNNSSSYLIFEELSRAIKFDVYLKLNYDNGEICLNCYAKQKTNQ